MEHKERKFFPLFMDFTQKKAVVIGGGKIATRRVKSMLEFMGEITVIAPECTDEIEKLYQQGKILYKNKKYESHDIEDADMVLAITDDKNLNEEIYSVCRQKNILVNISSNQEKCDFHFPGILEYDEIVIGFNGHGKNHKKVRQIRETIQEILDNEGEYRIK